MADKFIVIINPCGYKSTKKNQIFQVRKKK